MKRARAAGFGVAPTGLAHGTVTVIVEGRPIEVTTLRRDVATDGRHAKVAFGRDFRDDALRRDFTINALSLARDGHGPRLRRRARRPRRPACPLHRRRAPAHPRGLSAHPALLPLFRPLRRGALDARDCARRSPSARDWRSCRANGCGPSCSNCSPRRAPARSSRGLRGGPAACAARGADRRGAIRPAGGDRGGAARRRRTPAAPGRALRTNRGGRRAAARAPAPFQCRIRTARRVGRGLAGLHDGSAPPPFGALRLLLFERRRQGALDALRSPRPTAARRPTTGVSPAPASSRATPEPTLPITGADVVARGVTHGQRVGATLKKLQACGSAPASRASRKRWRGCSTKR